MKGEGGILFYLCPSKIFFAAFFSVTVDDRNLIFGHKRHIGTPYCGKRFLDPSDSYFLFADLIFIHIEHICSFLYQISSDIYVLACQSATPVTRQ